MPATLTFADRIDSSEIEDELDDLAAQPNDDDARDDMISASLMTLSRRQVRSDASSHADHEHANDDDDPINPPEKWVRRRHRYHRLEGEHTGNDRAERM